jgi:hypothetical protein
MSEPDSASEPQDFSLIRVLVFAWRVCRQHFWALFVPSLCSGILLSGLIALLDVPPQFEGITYGLLAAFIGVIVPVGIYCSLLSWSRGGDRPTLGGILTLGLRGWWDGVRVYLVLLLCGVFLAFVLGMLLDVMSIMLNIWIYGALVASLFIWITSRCFLSMICMADDGQGAFDAVQRGLSLTEGKSLRIAPAIILLAVVFVAFTMAVSYGSYWLRVRFPAQACSQAFVILSEPFIYAFVFAVYLELKNLQKPAWTPGPAPSSGQEPPSAPQASISDSA